MMFVSDHMRIIVGKILVISKFNFVPAPQLENNEGFTFPRIGYEEIIIIVKCVKRFV